MKERVLAAMSGGVDSSVTVALLQQAGYDVIGVTMQIWPEIDPACAPAGLRSCCSMSAVEDARRVAQRLGIPHYVLNFRDEFARLVIEPYIQTYLAGQTPNPCIICNKEMKFDVLLRRALELECRWLATGHYVRVQRHDDRWQLLTARDPSKDQTYALYSLTQEQLSYALFPLGEYIKKDVRSLAAELDLPVAEKPDSQEVCFVTEGEYKDFIAKATPESVQPGPILNLQGDCIGTHQGIAFYTVGQRRGLQLNTPEPQYVVRIDPAANSLVVGPEESLYRRQVLVGQLNYVSFPALQETTRLMGKLRYTMIAQPCQVEQYNDGRVMATFDEPQRAPTPGQAAVFYDGERVAFGGVIELQG